MGRPLGEMLQRLGYRFEVTVSGGSAQVPLAQRDYDLALCDLRMPGQDGPGLYDWMAERGAHLRVRFCKLRCDPKRPTMLEGQ